MEDIFSAFLWGTYKGKPKKRWKSWRSMALRTCEGAYILDPFI